MKTSYCHHLQPPKHRNLSKKHNGLYSISSKHHKQNTQAHIHKFEVLNILFVNDSIQIINPNLITLPNSQTKEENGYRNYLRSSKMRETMTTAAGRHVARRKLVNRVEQRKESWENDQATLEMEGQLKITKKNQSFLLLTALQAGNKVAGAGKGRSRRSLMGQRRGSKFWEREEEEVRNQHLHENITQDMVKRLKLYHYSRRRPPWLVGERRTRRKREIEREMSSGEGSKTRIESLGKEVAPTTAPTAVPAVPSGGWKSEEEEKSKGRGEEKCRPKKKMRKEGEEKCM